MALSQTTGSLLSALLLNSSVTWGKLPYRSNTHSVLSANCMSKWLVHLMPLERYLLSLLALY
jgi:hypothetical protein